MVEVSGIPFGLMGEMLQDGGNPWRGMLFSMTSRLPWARDPAHLWNIWDNFRIEQSQMIGYWVDHCPVKTDHPKVLATVYQKKDKVMISLASWAEKDINIKCSATGSPQLGHGRGSLISLFLFFPQCCVRANNQIDQ
jgi:hypothetical protein